ncbi:class F sortase [Nonomuraea sp. NPDC050310]|uniref:class F sortase n=1 Tax=unclassified Nonomuraea TaxID=2593643 RepID=UPI003406D80D
MRRLGWAAGALVLAAATGCLPGGYGMRAVPEEAAVLPARVAGTGGWPVPYGGELGRAEPNRVLIPRLKVDAPLVVLGMAEDGTLAVPPLEHANVAGWFGGGPTPGEKGSAVLAGHLDTRTGPAVFARLGELVRGDVVGVVRGDGTVTVFAVERLERAPKTDFPADRVYGPSERRELRLVTCGGAFDQARHSYRDNVIVHTVFRAAYLARDFRQVK